MKTAKDHAQVVVNLILQAASLAANQAVNQTANAINAATSHATIANAKMKYMKSEKKQLVH